MKSILIIGMGQFGRFLSEKFLALGNDIMIVDKKEAIIEEMAPRFTNAQIGDCTNEDVLKALGVSSFDTCFVTIEENFQSSLEITSLLHELGAKHVVSKSSRDIQAKFLLRNGADEVVYPDKDSAERLAVKYSANNVFDYIQLGQGYSIFELAIMKDWIGKSISTLDIRAKHKVNVLAVKQGGKISLPTPDYAFLKDDHIVVLGIDADVKRLTNKL